MAISTDAPQVEELILENERRKSWLIFYSHDVRETPSPFGCTPALLDFAVLFAAQRGGRVRTVTDVVHELGKQRELYTSDDNERQTNSVQTKHLNHNSRMVFSMLQIERTISSNLLCPGAYDWHCGAGGPTDDVGRS